MSYKKIHAQFIKGSKYKIYLWDDGGYDEIYWNKPAFKDCLDHEATHQSIDGKPLKQVTKYRKDDHDIHFADMPAYQRFLIDRYGDNDTPSKNHKILFYDIETEMGESLTPEYIKKAPKKITSIAYYDSHTQEWGVFILDVKNNLNKVKKSGKLVIPCKNEEELLAKWIEKYVSLEPDIILGYNSWYFDDPYMYYRTLNVLGEEWANMYSPIGIVTDVSEWGGGDRFIDFAGIESLDYMKLHKKYYMRDEPDWSLGGIGEKYVNLGKIEYDGNLDRLFETDPNKFIDYNFRDVEILVKLEYDKFEYLPLTLNLAHKGKIRYCDILSSSKIHDGAISAYLLSQNIAPPSRDKNAIVKKNYAGGYLFCPEVGLFKYLFDEDLTSLYPSIIRSLNIGKETYVGKIVWEDDRFNKLGLKDLQQLDPNFELTIENDQRKTTQISVDKLIKIIIDNNFTISANGTMFRTDIKSVLSVVLEKWFNERVDNKNKMKESFKAGFVDKGKLFHQTQHALKILLNSLYGALSLPSFRYGSIVLSEAITLSGWRIIQESALFANTHMNKVIRSEISLDLS